MKATMTAFVACAAVTLSVTVAGAQQAPPTPPAIEQQKSQQPPEVILTGCIVQGSSPTVFVFDNAKKDPASAAEKGVKYLIVASAEDVDLRTHLNHEVRVVGQIDLKIGAQPAMPPDKPEGESALPRLNAKSITMVSNTCSLAR